MSPGTPSDSPIGVDIGGTGIKGAHVDVETGTLITERIRILTPSPATPDAVAGVVVSLLEQIGGSGAVGLTLPAVVRNGTVETASNIDGTWIGTEAVRLFSDATGRAVSVINDADAAGMAESTFGAARDVSGLVAVITLGTGIGSSLIVDGVLVPNTELGHLPLHHGDAEDWAADSVRENEALSWKKYAERLQSYLELVERVLWPSLFVIGGGVSKRANKFLPLLELRTPVVPASLQNEAGIVGAALLAPRPTTTAVKA
jgi:polyphosphate glucokinase